jgi:peptidoglycan/xylan/chitin deacetylase (PgdA/CDA1 family)
MASVNLCFHGVGEPERELEPGEDVYWIGADLFDDVLDIAAAHGDIGLSFDDGNDSDHRIGLPALQARGLSASFFPIAQRIDIEGSMGTAQLRELVDAGMSVGTHGMRHQSWKGLSDNDLREELVTARAAISRAAGVQILQAACPLGRYDRRVLSKLHRLGYSRVFTSDRARARNGSWLQPRFSIRHDDTPDSVRRLLGDTPALADRVKSSARITVKRLR